MHGSLRVPVHFAQMRDHLRPDRHSLRFSHHVSNVSAYRRGVHGRYQEWGRNRHRLRRSPVPRLSYGWNMSTGRRLSERKLRSFRCGVKSKTNGTSSFLHLFISSFLMSFHSFLSFLPIYTYFLPLSIIPLLSSVSSCRWWRSWRRHVCDVFTDVRSDATAVLGTISVPNQSTHAALLPVR